MKVARKLLVSGGITLALAGGTMILPFSQTAGAAQLPSLETITKPVESMLLNENSNAWFNVKTEVDSRMHAVGVMVTNVSDKDLVPQVSYDGETPDVPIKVPLKPGETREFSNPFTGNHFAMEVKVAAEGAETLTTLARVNVHEPVTFRATETNDTVVIGELQNNSSLVPQTVYVKGNAETKVEHLEPGESRTIAISNTAGQNQKLAAVTVATSTGYESMYVVELGLTPGLPIPLQ